MSAADKALPKGALEEAVALFDELLPLTRNTGGGSDTNAKIDDLVRRRAALEPRLARRRENQAKPRAHEVAPPTPKAETTGEPDYPRCKICGEKHFDGMGDDFHT